MRGCALAALGLVGAIALWAACDQPISHVFIAGQYDPKLDCVYPGTAVDVLNGAPVDDAATCDATCIVPPFDSGVYVTGVCPPFPQGDQVSPKNPQCAPALAAIHRHDLCVEGGASGPSGDAGVDAGKMDAKTD